MCFKGSSHQITMSSTTNQAYNVNRFGEGSVTLPNGKIYHFAEMSVRVVRARTKAELAGYSSQSEIFTGPPDKDGFWHFLVLSPHDFGRIPQVLAQLSPEESDDMIRKIYKSDEDEYLYG